MAQQRWLVESFTLCLCVGELSHPHGLPTYITSLHTSPDYHTLESIKAQVICQDDNKFIYIIYILTNFIMIICNIYYIL